MVNMSSSNQSTPRSTMMSGLTSQQIPFTVRSTVDDFREIIREQSFILPNNCATEYETLDVPVKKYPPLPDINGGTLSSTHNTFYRTESNFITSNKSVPGKKQMFYHFARTQRGHLPALNSNMLPTSFSNVMDLDENLPECYTRIPNRVQTYTSPNDRLSSPIKRPSAPSPPASAQVKRAGQNAFVHRNNNEDDDEFDSESDDIQSQLFEENFHRCRQPSTKRYTNVNNNQPNTLLIYDDPSSSFSALDLQG